MTSPTACGFCKDGTTYKNVYKRGEWYDRIERPCRYCYGTGQALTPAEAFAEVERLRAEVNILEQANTMLRQSRDAEVERLRAALDTEKEANATGWRMVEAKAIEVERLRDRLALFAEWYRTFLKAVGYSTYACQLCGADAASEHAETCALEAVVHRMVAITVAGES